MGDCLAKISTVQCQTSFSVVVSSCRERTERLLCFKLISESSCRKLALSVIWATLSCHDPVIYCFILTINPLWERKGHVDGICTFSW